MSKINAIRLVNVNYNHNSIHISDETLHFSGRSTLISLQNGGGKSVLVQLLTAPFVQKRYRNLNERSFASYFTTSKPSFIMVEWVLEDDAGYCLTGMMVRKSQNIDNEEELELINFISEYTEPCEQDINHLPVVESDKKELRIKSFNACHKMFDEYKKERINKFFCYDMNNSAQSRQYFAKLAEYGIDYREWQNIIKKINEEESGLSKLFAECKDEKGLVEKWFLDAVENKLNKGNNRMQEFRNILEKYIATYNENSNKIKQQEKLTAFQQEAAPILAFGNEYEASSSAVAVKLNKIYECLAELSRFAAKNETEIAICNAELEALGKQLVHLLHEEFSSKFYYAEDKKEALIVLKEDNEQQSSQLEEQSQLWERRRHILDCAEIQERLNEDVLELQRVEQRVAVSRKKNKDLEPEREYIGYLLKEYIEQELQKTRGHFQQEESDKKACLDLQKQAKQELSELISRLNELHTTQGRLQGLVQAYDDAEESYNKKWEHGAAGLQRNMLGEYEAGALKVMAEKLVADEQEASDRQKQQQQNLSGLKTAFSDLERSLQNCSKERGSKEQLLVERTQVKKQLDEQLAKRKTLLQYLQLDEIYLFDKGDIQKELSKKLWEMDEARTKLLNELNAVQKKYQGLQTGKILELSDELVQMLERLGINIVYGMEWLKNNKNSEELNLELVKQHPFLPYALIMTSKDIEILQRAEKNIYTSFPVPIILRESLAQATQTKVDNGVLKSADVNFFMLFNDNLLNEEKLQRLLAELKAELQKIEQELQQRKDEYDFYRTKYSELQDQSLSKESYERLKDELLSLQEAIAKLQKREEHLRAEKADNLLEQEKLSQDLIETGRLIEKLQLHQEALQQLTEKYQQYLLDNSQLYECSNALAKAENAKNSLDDKLEKLQNKLEWQIKILADLSGNMKDLNDELAQYAGYKQVPKPKNFADDIAQNVNTLKAYLKSIQEKLFGELRALEDNRANLAKKVQKVEQKLRDRANRFGLESKDWVNERYSEAKMQELDAKQKQLTQDKKKLGDARIVIEKRLTQVQGEQNNILRQMEEKCHAVEPLPKDEVVEKNFAEEKNMLQYKRTLKEGLQKSLGEQEQNIRENIVGLAEYSEGATNVEWCESFNLEDFSQEELSSYTLSLRKEYKTAQVQEDEAKRKLEQALIRLRNVEAFQEDSYKKCIDMLQELTSDAQIFVKQLNAVLESYVRISEKLQVDIAIVKQEKEQIITQLEDYLKEVHKQLGYIDRNSSIQIRGHYVKMLKLQLPDWEESANIYHRSITDLVDTIAEKGLAKLSKGEPLAELLGKLLTTKELFDAVVGINNVHVQMFKVEAQREIQISWRDVARNSGGEGFLSAFVILSSLLYYMRRDDADVYADRNEGKVLMMDNPFAQTNAAHLLTPLMEMAAKNNTQLISFTGLGGESIYNCYDNIYVLNLISSKLSNISYLKSKHIAGNDGEFLSLARVEVIDEGQIDSLF
ncbi:hypothetical protein [Phascolarctobacterium succinatutens]